MTADAIIDQIKALPKEEQAKVIDFLEEVKSERGARTIPAETFNESAKRIFDRHEKLMEKLSQ